MIWELTVACPLPYKDDGPFDWSNIVEVEPKFKNWLTQLQHSLITYQFEVVIDGLSLRRPNQYPLAFPRTGKQERTNRTVIFSAGK